MTVAASPRFLLVLAEVPSKLLDCNGRCPKTAIGNPVSACARDGSGQALRRRALTRLLAVGRRQPPEVSRVGHLDATRCGEAKQCAARHDGILELAAARILCQQERELMDTICGADRNVATMLATSPGDTA
eukprot:4384996-Prymnesium_polylepis.1